MDRPNMERVHNIQAHPLFQASVRGLLDVEKERAFCRHTLEHFLDVARLMYIYCLEDGAGIPKDVLYAAALLHDLGRYAQAVDGTPHEIAGAQIAAEILMDCGFTESETQAVRAAILGHRDAEGACGDRLSAYLYRADKASRCCFACAARDGCYWPEDKKNLWIEY